MSNENKNVVTEQKRKEIRLALETLDMQDIEYEVDKLINKTNLAMDTMNILGVFVSATVIGIPLSLVVMIWYGVSIGFKILITCLGLYLAFSIAIGFLDNYSEMNRSILIAISEIIDEIAPDDENIIENEDY